MKTIILIIILFADDQVIVKNAEENMQRVIFKISKRRTIYNLLTSEKKDLEHYLNSYIVVNNWIV
jgi:hypothetical protein